MVGLPDYEVLHFCFDNDNGCSLTVLANDERFHVTVNPKQFQDRSKKGKDIQRCYRQLLQKAKAAEEEEDQEDGATSPSEDETDIDNSADDAEMIEDRDSAIDVSTPELDEKANEGDNGSEPARDLHNWILTPLCQHLPSSSSKAKTTLQDWYHKPIQFYTLSTASGKLQAKENTSPAKSLTDRLDEILIPTVCLPKKTLNLSIPQFNASDLTVISCATDPAPFHPVLVSHKKETYFLKPVDPTQPGPTIREIHLLHAIAKKGLHSREDFRCTELRGLVHFSSESSSKTSGEKKHIAALLLSPIPNPTPLTLLIDTTVSEQKREQWAKDAARMVEVLHENDLVWGDAKGDNFLVDGEEEKVWMIDFGGSWTEGWVDEKLKETEEGDWMGTEKIVNALEDPVNGTTDGDEEQEVGEEAEEQGTEEEEEGEAEDEDSNGTEPEEHAKPREAEEEVHDADEIEERDADDDEGSEGLDEENHQSHSADDQTISTSSSSARKRSHAAITEDKDNQAPPSKQQKRSQDAKYCFCDSASSGRMLACDGEQCRRMWFHFDCLGIEEAPQERQWFCDECR